MQRLNDGYSSISKMASQLINQKSVNRNTSTDSKDSFEEILNSTQKNSAESLKFSKHANERLADRNINLSAEQMERLENGTTKAREKGIQESLVMVDDLAFIVNVKNNTVITAMNDKTDSIFTKYKKLPNTKGKTLVADVSSCFLSEPVNVSDYGIIYGGVQKNIGPAGMVISIIRDDLITDDVLPGTPTMMKFKTHADAGSLYNTPNCYCIYMCGKVFKWLKKMGGLEVMKQRNEEKAKLLYDFLDQSKLFKGTVVPEDRSLMNVPFITGNADLDAKFVKESKEAGLENLKGHRTVGGMRASIYNAMPKKGVETLVAFMKKFEEENL